MIRFNLGPIPVEARYSHFLMLAALALSFLPGQASKVSVLFSVAFIGLAMAVIFVSVLVHELGHALASLAFGYRPDIQLVWLGGQTRPNAQGSIPWYRDVLLTLAGPVFGLSLGLLCLWTKGVIGPTSVLVRQILGVAMWVNFVWSALNLLPVLPLDGGRISAALLIRVFGRRGYFLAQLLALGISGLFVLWFLTAQVRDPYLIFLFALFGMRAITQIASYLRGESPPGLEHPSERALLEAEVALGKDHLDEAKKQVDVILQQGDLPPALRSRAHHLRGWIHVKEGQGRAALDQFAQVSSRKVEPRALAAAFALIGDEERAAGLWEIAYRETGDRIVLHEWAGTLIRAGKVEEARRMRGVDLPLAFLCAQRVFSIRGRHSEAANVGLLALTISPQPQIAYDTACALARAGDAPGALRILRKAAELGFKDADVAESDADLAYLHTYPEFHAWLRQLREMKGS